MVSSLQFGTGFLNKMECSQCPSPILENLTFVDTPGVLSGEKQRVTPPQNTSFLCTQTSKPSVLQSTQYHSPAFPLPHSLFLPPCRPLSSPHRCLPPQIGRSYDFVAVMSWFAEKSDLILLLFDAHKLDISDEFKRTISALKDYDEKIRVVLNKSDTIETQALMRVYGALMWSLGKVTGTPEVKRVYISSFWEYGESPSPPSVDLYSARSHPTAVAAR